jgi:8-oxo-dGTP diphosphatase
MDRTETSPRRECTIVNVDRAVVRDIVQEFGAKRFRLVTRLDRESPPVENISTAHCLAFDSDGHVLLTLHRERGWTIPGGHLEHGESAADAMIREAEEEAGAVVDGALLFAHEEINPEDGAAADPRYPVPSFQVFYAARLVSLGAITATDECTEARLFTPAEARVTPGWIQRNPLLFEAAVALAESALPPPRP